MAAATNSGGPANPETAVATRSKLWTVCPYILGNEFCERLAYYGIATNMVIYLTDRMGLSYGAACMQVSLFSGTCYMTPLLGAWLADCYWGRYKAILVFSTVYCMGMFGLAASALVPVLKPEGVDTTPFQAGVFFIALYTVALGTGGIKPNVSAFGADQFDDKIRQDRRDKESFFNYFYLSINVGSLIACTLVVGVQVHNWGLGFAIPAVAMGLAVLCFLAGKSKYTHQDATGSPMNRVVHVLYMCCADFFRKIFCCGDSHAQNGHIDGDEAHASLLESQEMGSGSPRDLIPNDFLEKAGTKAGYMHNQIEEVRMVTRMFPIFILTIMYWAVYSQMASVFVMQGQVMDRNIPWGSGTINIPAASLTVFDTIAIVVLIPLYDGIFVPLMKRFGGGFTLLQRIGWGMFIAVLAMLMAAYIEQRRMAAMAAGSNISVMEQSTQFLLVGLSEVLASIGQIEFFYDQAPDVMRSCCSALQLLSTALGSYLSAYFLFVVTRYTTWITDMNHGSRLDLYFIVLAGIMLLNTFAFVIYASKYKYKVVRHRAPMPRVGGQAHAAGQNDVRPSTTSGRSQAISISGRPEAGFGYQWNGTPNSYMGATPDVDPHGRSMTYMPNTPAMPAHYK